MNRLRLLINTVFLLNAVALSGCASQAQIQSLQADIAALQTQTEKASSDANQALQDTTLLKNELSAVRKSSESASADASATRKLLEQLNARLERGSATKTFK